jgi:hypothetical protein
VTYFTPELFVKLQECDTPAEFRAVNAEWEAAAEQYRVHLQALGPTLPAALRRFVRRGSLHDAHVLDIGTAERKWTLIVQEELAPRLLSLTYSFVDEPVLDREAILAEHRTPHTAWLYDELEVETDRLYRAKTREERATANVASDPEWKPIYRHSILLSNGWELRLRFHALSASCTTSLLRTDGSPHTLAAPLTTPVLTS